MFRVTVICVGKLKEPFYAQASAEYLKRLSAFCRAELCELPETRLPDSPSPAQVAQALEREGAAILAHVPKGACLIVCTPEGKLLSSEELASYLAARKAGGAGSVCLVIGSSFGLAPAVKRQAELLLSFSRMTFPHHLFRVMALEQVYRAESIQAGIKYHK